MSWGNPQTTGEKIISAALWPASLAYGLGAYSRLLAYRAGWLKIHSAEATVVSVGNITCGGTGKTPVTIDITRRLLAAGHRVAVLSRGYRRRSHEEVVVVSDGNTLSAGPDDAGDEAYLIARSAPQAVVIVGSKRYVTADVAVKIYGCDMLVLDDGFQHLSLSRDVNIALVDYNDEPDKDALLPRGRLREPLSALTRADYVVISKVPPVPDPERLEALEKLVRRYAPSAVVTACRFETGQVEPFHTSQKQASLSGLKVLTLAGIARPEPFVRQVESLGASIAGRCDFADHHWYTKADLAAIDEERSRLSADAVVTTEKDAARLTPHLVGKLPLYVLSIKTAWLGSLPLPERLLLPRRLPEGVEHG